MYTKNKLQILSTVKMPLKDVSIETLLNTVKNLILSFNNVLITNTDIINFITYLREYSYRSGNNPSATKRDGQCSPCGEYMEFETHQTYNAVFLDLLDNNIIKTIQTANDITIELSEIIREEEITIGNTPLKDYLCSILTHLTLININLKCLRINNVCTSENANIQASTLEKKFKDLTTHIEALTAIDQQLIEALVSKLFR